MANRKPILIYVLIFLLLCLNILLIGIWYFNQPRPNLNALAIGTQSNTANDQVINIPLQPPMNFNSMTRAQVLALREKAVNQYPSLLATPYHPSDAVFAQIEDYRPWWGIAGQFYYGAGESSIRGESEESRFVLNPFLLVAADFYAPNNIDSTTLWNWNKTRITETDLNRPDFPYACSPQDLRWQPRNSQVQVTYDITQCLARLSRWTIGNTTLADVAFDLTAYNARDLNLNYIQLIQAESPNVKFSVAFNSPIVEPEMIHRGGSCQYPGGCNNASPYIPQISELTLQAVPAQLTIYLWKDDPTPLRLTQPDMRFVIYFK